MFRNWGFEAEAETIPGATLARHWRSGQAKSRILEGAWHIVVLQDDLPEYKTRDKSVSRLQVICEQFNPVLTKFVEVVRSTGALPVMYMAHPYERLSATTLSDICLAHKLAEKSLGVWIAPGGLAHSLMDERAKEMSLLDDDLEHPSQEGLYLHALTIIMACFGQDKLDEVQWAPASMTDSVVRIFKQTAIDSLESWQTIDLSPDIERISK